MDKNTWIGFGLIAVIIVGFSLLNKPSKEQLAQQAQQQEQPAQQLEPVAQEQTAKEEKATSDTLSAAEKE